MAAEGLRFTNMHVQPICTPTRNQIMTGRGNRRNYVGFGKIGKGEITFGHLLQTAGYATAVAGKWQLGDKGRGPAEAGFEHCNIREMESGWHRYWGGNLWVDGEAVAITDDQYAPDVQLKWALDWIDANRERPFFLYYPTPLIHDPYVSIPDRYTAGEPQPGHGTDHGRPLLAPMITQLDRQMGALCDFLRERGLAENTLVLFIGDNGTAAPVKRADGQVIPSGKGRSNIYGTHSPCIAWWPGRIQPGVAEDLVCVTDIVPTVVEAAGAQLPTDREYDGISVLPRLLKGTPSPRQVIYHWWSQTNKEPVIWAHDARWSLYSDGRLFDTQADPEEQTPLESNPESDAVRQRLQAELDRQAKVTPPAQAWEKAAKVKKAKKNNAPPEGGGEEE
jgi:arylsulfatase A